MKPRLKIGVVGATGAVGQTAIDILENEFQAFELEELRLFASRSSAGKRVPFRKGGLDVALTVEDTNLDRMLGCDVVFFATDSFISLEFIPTLASAGVLCIDKSSAYREDPTVLLVVPEVNGMLLGNPDFLKFPVVANPNCCATPLAVALAPLHKAFGLERVIVSTYQSVSGSGKPGIDALREESKGFFSLQDLKSQPSQVYPKAIAFNVFPFVSKILDNGDTEEESKLIFEVKKILDLKNLRVSATSVRVPTFVGHAEAVTVELNSSDFSLANAKQVLQQAPGVCFVDEWEVQNPEEEHSPMRFPTPRDVQGQDPVYIGRVRLSAAFERGLSFWVCADNLRKGAALNGIQVVESFCDQGLMAKLRQKRSR